MTNRNLLLLSNGYGEDSFAAILLEKFIQLSKIRQLPCHFFIFPLVGEGAQFLKFLSQFPDQISLVSPLRSLPNGGVYLGSAFQKGIRLFDDCVRGIIPNGGYLLRQLGKIKERIDAVVGIGDFIPPLMNSLFLRKKMYMVACAHTSLLKRNDHRFERLGRLTSSLFRRDCYRVYTRDRLTEDWFHQLKIPATYLGFLGPDMCKSDGSRRKIVILPGSRNDWKENLQFCIQALEEMRLNLLSEYKLHIVFSPGRSYQEICSFVSPGLETQPFRLSWSRGDYFQHLFQSILVVGFAGTALEQAAFLGIPSIEPWRLDALQANRDFIENRQKLLLREALIPGGNSPSQLAQIFEDTLLNLPVCQQSAEEFSQRVWEGRSDGGKAIAEDIFDTLNW